MVCVFVGRGSERGRAIVANLDFFVLLLADLLFLCFADLLFLTNKAANTQSFPDKSDKEGKPFYRQCFVSIAQLVVVVVVDKPLRDSKQ